MVKKLLVLNKEEVAAMSMEELQRTINKFVNQGNRLEDERTEIREKSNTVQEQIKITRALSRMVKNELSSRKVEVEQKTFKQSLFEEFGEGIPEDRLEKCFRLAYDEGHSAGENEIRNYFIDYVELFK